MDDAYLEHIFLIKIKDPLYLCFEILKLPNFDIFFFQSYADFFLLSLSKLIFLHILIRCWMKWLIVLKEWRKDLENLKDVGELVAE